MYKQQKDLLYLDLEIKQPCVIACEGGSLVGVEIIKSNLIVSNRYYLKKEMKNLEFSINGEAKLLNSQTSIVSVT